MSEEDARPSCEGPEGGRGAAQIEEPDAEESCRGAKRPDIGNSKGHADAVTLVVQATIGSERQRPNRGSALKRDKDRSDPEPRGNRQQCRAERSGAAVGRLVAPKRKAHLRAVRSEPGARNGAWSEALGANATRGAEDCNVRVRRDDHGERAGLHRREGQVAEDAGSGARSA